MNFSVPVRLHGDHVTGEFSTTARGPCLGERPGHEVGRVDFGDGANPWPPGVGRDGGGREAAMDGALAAGTDKDGRFRSSSCIDPGRPGLVLLVQASGLAWAVHHVAVTPEITPQ